MDVLKYKPIDKRAFPTAKGSNMFLFILTEVSTQKAFKKLTMSKMGMNYILGEIHTIRKRTKSRGRKALLDKNRYDMMRKWKP